MESKRYCSFCEKLVSLKGKEANPSVYIVLLLFTAGIGLIFYIIYCLAIKSKRCDKCGRFTTIVEPKEDSLLSVEEQPGDATPKLNYCIYCGAEISNPLTQFCPNCGTKKVVIYEEN